VQIRYCITFSALIFQGTIASGFSLGLAILIMATVVTRLRSDAGARSRRRLGVSQADHQAAFGPAGILGLLAATFVLALMPTSALAALFSVLTPLPLGSTRVPIPDYQEIPIRKYRP